MTRSITRWAPETDFLRGRFDRMFHQMLQDAWGGQAPAEGASDRAWMPAVDVKESEDTLGFAVELPGLTRDDIEITIENNILTIAGERKFEKEVKGEEYHRLERSYGHFSRSFTLPVGIRTDAVEADFTDGVLHVRLPKQENAKPRKIEIR
jgi:HSP20 family protein